jgi:hypothetical protein
MSHFYLVLRNGRVDAVFRFYIDAFVWIQREGGRIMRDDTFEARFGADAQL